MTEEGPLEDVNEVVRLLRRFWDDIQVQEDEPLTAEMLDRIEDPVYRPPNLKFDIQRPIGDRPAKWAKVERWVVNLSDMTAMSFEMEERKVREHAPHWFARPVAEEVADKILAGESDPRYDIEVKIRIHSDEVTPDSRMASKETRERRKKRFYEELDRLLETGGFERGLFIYHKEE